MSFDPPTNSTKFYELITYSNNATDGWMSNLLLMAMFIVLLMILLKGSRQTGAAFAAAGFVTSIFAVGFWVMGAVGWHVMVIFIFITSVGAAAIYYENK